MMQFITSQDKTSITRAIKRLYKRPGYKDGDQDLGLQLGFAPDNIPRKLVIDVYQHKNVLVFRFKSEEFTLFFTLKRNLL